MSPPSPAPSAIAPVETPVFAPKIGGVSPQLRTKISQLVADHPDQSLRVLREWMAEGERRDTRH